MNLSTISNNPLKAIYDETLHSIFIGAIGDWRDRSCTVVRKTIFSITSAILAICGLIEIIAFVTLGMLLLPFDTDLTKRCWTRAVFGLGISLMTLTEFQIMNFYNEKIGI